MAEDKNEAGGDDNNEANQVASESVNRSSSFLFDSLYDSSLLAGLDPHQILDQSEEKESVGQEVRDECQLPSTRERQRSEILANQEAEKQEAVQWGESSFNLSEWGDSLLVGEHFLERQSLLRHTERTQKGQAASLRQGQQPSTDHVLSEQQLSRSPQEPGEIQAKQNCIINPNELQEDNTTNNQGPTRKNGDRPGGRQEMPHEQGENGREKEMEEEGNVCLTDEEVFKHPHVQNAPERTLYCSPDLQEIFDRWPSMSDQPWQHVTTGVTGTHTHTAAAAANTVGVPEMPPVPMEVDRNRPNEQSAAGESDPRDEQQLRRDAVDYIAENAIERQGSAGDLIPPTQEKTPVTPRVKLTTLSVNSPLAAKPLNQSTPSDPLQGQPAPSKCPTAHSEHSNLLKSANLPDVSDKHLESTSDLNHKCQLGQKSKTLPEPDPHPKVNINSVPHSSSLTKPLTRTGQKLSPPQLKLPSDLDSSEIDEGFTLRLSQDAPVCPSNSGAFSIIDVGSDQRLFHTFISEWKTKRRYSLALACEKTERIQQTEERIGEKHNRGKRLTDL